MEFIGYKKCSTCTKAKNELKKLGYDFSDRDIVENTPTKLEIEKWIKKYDMDIDCLFNTRGTVYKELNLKDRLKDLSLDEKIKLLSSDGMLIKRPIVIADKKIIIGNKIKEYTDIK